MPGSLRLLLATLRGAGVRVAGVEFSSREAGLAFSRAPEYYLQRGEPWPYNPRVSLVNFLLQQYSLDRVSELWWPHRSRYAVVAYLRPDLFFFNPLPVPEPVENATLYAPDFDTWGGINDRFGFGTPWTMDHYGHRMRLAEAYFREVPPRRGGIKNYKKMVWADGSMHSETFLRETMRMCGVRYAPIQNFTFGRVRAHGAVV
ncbi:hypothetical protein DFJ74DRAFT_650610 [Hyaloraphidium curvatum]|nr:hypothetical protein DFJ74DRAFT_650610 [Hyaloraphidium curvatum]